jgi:hypothetical protein
MAADSRAHINEAQSTEFGSDALRRSALIAGDLGVTMQVTSKFNQSRSVALQHRLSASRDRSIDRDRRRLRHRRGAGGIREDEADK